jgi:hypothetical protein
VRREEKEERVGERRIKKRIVGERRKEKGR